MKIENNYLRLFWVKNLFMKFSFYFLSDLSECHSLFKIWGENVSFRRMRLNIKDNFSWLLCFKINVRHHEIKTRHLRTLIQFWFSGVFCLVCLHLHPTEGNQRFPNHKKEKIVQKMDARIQQIINMKFNSNIWHFCAILIFSSMTWFLLRKWIHF